MRKAIWIREYLALAVIVVALVLLFGALDVCHRLECNSNPLVRH